MKRGRRRAATVLKRLGATLSKHNISIKFIVFISLAVIVFLTGVYVVSFSVMRNYILEDATDVASTILGETNTKINRFFHEIEAICLGLSKVKAVYSLDAETMKDLFIAIVMARKDYIRAIYLGTTDGRMLEWGYGEGFSDYIPRLPEDFDPRVRPWYKATLAADDFTVSEPYVYASIEALGITGGIPVRTAQGELVGIMGIDILLTDLQNLLETLDIPKQGKAILLNKQGEIIASQLSSHGEAELELKQSKLVDIQQVQSAKMSHFIRQIEGEITHISSKANETTGWLLLLAFPYDSIMEPVSRILSLMAVIHTLLMVMLIASLGLITRWIIISPLENIITVINRIESGERNARVTVESGDEFAILGNELNKLADTVNEYSYHLEEKVRQRTEEITNLQQEITRLRIIEEKKRIYRDMHDALGAKLTNICICNSVAQRLARDRDGKLSRLLGRIEKNCQQAIQNLKDIILGMKDDEQVASDFAGLMLLNIEQRLKPQNIVFESALEDPAVLNNLHSDLKVEIEKILLELVSNVLKNARARRVYCGLKLKDHHLRLVFKDDGIGFDYPRMKKTGFGLRNISYRVARLGGTVEVTSTPGEGTRFEIEMPVQAERHDDDREE
jgi:signal transduction histidine kinase